MSWSLLKKWKNLSLLLVLTLILLNVASLLWLGDWTSKTTNKQSPLRSIIAQGADTPIILDPTETNPSGAYVTTTTTIRRRTVLRNSGERRVQPQQVSPQPIAGDVWWRLFGCETGGTYNAAINTGNGYYGAFQFSLSTWKSVGGTGYPHQHPYETQRAFAIKLQQRSGWGQWPACSRKLGLR